MRFTALDALRGTAAFSVVIFHALRSLPETKTLIDIDVTNIYSALNLETILLTLSPIRFLYMGDEAVILFFVLSGFVLSLPFLQQNSPPYLGYALKRCCRLFLPAIAAVLLSIGLLLLAGTIPSARPMPILDILWREQPSIDMLLQHMVLLSDAISPPTEVYPLDPPLWSLEVEWHCSLLLPFLVLLARRSGALALAVAASGLVLAALEQRFLDHHLLISLRFLPLFALGVLLCRNRLAVAGYIRSLSVVPTLALWLLCMLLLDINALLASPALQTHHRLAIGAGATLLIALILASDRAQRFLNLRPLLWLGKISFSLYLLHMPVMLALSRLFADDLSPSWRIIAAVGLSFPLAAVFHRWVEIPSIEAGRRLGRWSQARRAPRVLPANQSSGA